MREKYQGIVPPVARTEQDFDPGAKYHVPANTPYARYFLAAILQFQFHRALCREAGFTGPLYQCSIYGNKKAGEKLKAMLAMGASEPWPAALKAMLPWLVAHVEQAKREMGGDWWSYGLAPNRHVLETFLRYHREQGLSKKRLAPEDLFAPETAESFKI